MSNNDVALLVAEAPWFSPKDNVGQASGLPFFEGVRNQDLIKPETFEPAGMAV